MLLEVKKSMYIRDKDYNFSGSGSMGGKEKILRSYLGYYFLKCI